MDNIDLEKKVKEIIGVNNFFDAMQEIKEFEKEYTRSDFYKRTKMPLFDAVKYAKLWYGMNFESIRDNLQELINSLDCAKLMEIINKLGDTFAQENDEVRAAVSEFADLFPHK